MSAHPHFIWKDLFRIGKAKQRTLIDVLQENVLFKTLTRAQLRYLANFVYERTYEVDEPVCSKGDRGIGMYIIAKGRVAIRTPDAKGGEGAETLVTSLGEGSFFGEIALVEPESIRTASVVPLERTTLIGFFKPDLLDILERKPDMGVQILIQLSTVLASRLVKTTEVIMRMKSEGQVVPATPRNLRGERDDAA